MNGSKAKTTKFKHSGDMGDIVYSLPVIKALGGGTLYLDPEGGLSSDLVGWKGHRKTKLNASSIDSLKVLLENQSYLTEVRYWSGEEVDYDLDRFRLYADGKRNLVESHSMAFGVKFNGEPWLDVRKRKVSKYVISRSLRYHGNYEYWEQFDKSILKDSVFIGLEEEHRYFKLVFGHDVKYYKTASIIDAAEVIAGCEYYFANQSLLSAIGQGIHANMTVELYRDTKTNFFERDGARYV